MVDLRLQGRQVRLRQSQIKFPSPDLTLNVIRCSRWSQGFLSRQVINLLYSLGVPISYFKRAQEKALEMMTPERVKAVLNRFASVLQNAKRKRAKKQDSQEKLYLDPKDLRVPIVDLIFFGLMKGRNMHEFISLAFKKGIDLINDPILCGIINCLQVSNYQ